MGYQLGFREQFDFLENGVEAVADALANRETSSQVAFHELGLYIREEEWGEFSRRAEALNRASDVRAEVVGEEVAKRIELEEINLMFGPTYGGHWQDHLEGGVVKMGYVAGKGTVDEASLKSLMRSPDDLELIPVTYSWDELRMFAHRLSKAAEEQGLRHHVSPHAPENRAIITVEDAGFVVPVGLPEDGVRVEVDENALELDGHKPFTSNHSVLHQTPGLKVWLDNSGIGRPNIGCTWGLTGHTTSFNYVVVNAHCVLGLNTVGQTLGGGNYDVKVWQNGTSGTRISDSNPWVVARNRGSYMADSARIQANLYADTNCYHTETSTCGFSMTSRRSLYDYQVGQTHCAAFGASNDYTCRNTTKLIGEWFDDFRLQHLRVDGIPGPGDSGSGMKYANTWDGIWYAYSTQHGFFHPAYSVKTDLVFDFNCIPSGNNPSGWGSCPIGNPN